MLYNNDKLLLLAGPCSIESESICRAAAEVLLEVQKAHADLTVVFKASLDKANRTSLSGDRGPGMQDGLELLKMVKEEYKLPTITDIHLPDQATVVAEFCDVLQIPAFLCRQTDLLVAAAKTGKPVFVKKGQFLSPQEMKFVVQKLEAVNATEIWQGERGTLFGYQNLIVDMRSFPIMKNHGYPTIFDATHSVQLPGAAGGKSGGQREFVQPLAFAALAAGADGLFIETHPNPDEAISDGQSQVPLSEFPDLIDKCLKYWRISQEACVFK